MHPRIGAAGRATTALSRPPLAVVYCDIYFNKILRQAGTLPGGGATPGNNILNISPIP